MRAKNLMSDGQDINLQTLDEPRRCPVCKHQSPIGTEYCPACGYPIAPKTRVPEPLTTQQLSRSPVTLPRDAATPSTLPPKANIILQFLPSGTCITLSLNTPVILGRGTAPEGEEVLDLSAFNAVRHGVSRRHCKLERRGNQLIVYDIGSANGTYLNHAPLLPRREYIVAHGDQLVLGTLHLFVAFSSTEELTVTG